MSDDKLLRLARPLSRLIGVVLVSGVVAAVFGDFSDRYPAAWDPRIAPLADFVEQVRELEFDHPVYVDFLPERDFVEQVTRSEPTDDERTAADRDAAVLRSLGLVSGPVDLLAENDTVATEGIAAFYSPSSERITIRGDALTPLLRATIVHELVHTAQDQNFDLSRLTAAPTVAARNAIRALAEGDALRIERAYVEALPEDERLEYDRQAKGQGEEVELDESPQVLVALFAAPYTLGRPLIDLLDQIGGNERIDEAFAMPPSTEEHLLDPFSFLAGEARNEEVEATGVPEGVDPFEEGDFGTLLLYLMLAERLDPAAAFAAIDGWNGDDYAAYETADGQVCLAAAFAADDATQAAELKDALDRWAEALPQARPTVGLGPDDAVQITACDPGPDLDLEVSNRSVEALDVPYLRGLVGSASVAAGDVGFAECVGDRVIGSFSFAELSAPDSAIYGDGRFRSAIDAAQTGCAGP